MSRKTYEYHGESSTELYKRWNDMKKRCRTINGTNYKNYGGKGIDICKTWENYLPFRKWALVNGYKQGLSIDRINPHKNYTPSNCRWIKKSEQGKTTKRYLSNFCINGHPRNKDNIYLRPDRAGRDCRPCKAIASNKSYHKNKGLK